jgi:hypothetical protein
MVVERSGVRGQGAGSVAYCVALLAVLPLVAADVWTGFRLAQSDPVLSVISGAEQPLSVRSPGGVWAIVVALGWFSLAYRHRQVTLWEAALVLVGGSLALVRLGNAWVDAAVMLVPLGRQLAIANLKPVFQLGVAASGLCVAVLMLFGSRPPELSSAATQTALSAAGHGKILADWRWAGDLQRRVGADRLVLASGGVGSEPPDFWLDYVRIARGHERWASALRQMQVDLVVLESSDQQHQAAELIRASADWRVLYDANDALVAARASPL